MNTSRDLRANTRQSLQEQAHALHKEKRTRDISNRDEGPVGYTWSPRPLTAIRVAYFNADGQHNKDDLIHAAQAAAADIIFIFDTKYGETDKSDGHYQRLRQDLATAGERGAYIKVQAMPLHSTTEGKIMRVGGCAVIVNKRLKDICTITTDPHKLARFATVQLRSGNDGMSITGAYNKSDGDAIAKLIRDKLKIREEDTEQRLMDDITASAQHPAWLAAGDMNFDWQRDKGKRWKRWKHFTRDFDLALPASHTYEHASTRSTIDWGWSRSATVRQIQTSTNTVGTSFHKMVVIDVQSSLSTRLAMRQPSNPPPASALKCAGRGRHVPGPSPALFLSYTNSPASTPSAEPKGPGPWNSATTH